MSNTRIFFGIFVVLIGLLLLLDQWVIALKFDNWWQVLLLIPGVFLWIQFFSKRANPGLLIPGTILILYSLYFFFNQLTGHRFAGETSFIFVFAIACGLFIKRHFSKEKNNGLLAAGWILTGISIIIFLSTVSGGKWWPLLFIVIGIFLLIKNNARPPSPKLL